jgi:hypothetical protein
MVSLTFDWVKLKALTARAAAPKRFYVNYRFASARVVNLIGRFFAKGGPFDKRRRIGQKTKETGIVAGISRAMSDKPAEPLMEF